MPKPPACNERDPRVQVFEWRGEGQAAQVTVGVTMGSQDQARGRLAHNTQCQGETPRQIHTRARTGGAHGVSTATVRGVP